jgi:hypothetical protein
MPKLKCRRSTCKRTTLDPKAAGWGYMEEAPPEVPHWVGWWCPSCLEGLRSLLAEEGVTVTSERLQ